MNRVPDSGKGLRDPDLVLLWDFDGTIADTRGDIAQAVRAVLAGRSLPSLDTGAIIACTGRGVDVLLQRCLEISGSPPRDDADLAQALDVFRTYYTRHMTDHTTVYPGIHRLLHRLRDAGRVMGVVSNKTEAMTVAVAGRLGLADCFRIILGGDSLPVRKPDAGPILHALEACSRGAGPHNAAMIGDTMTDFHAARAAGIRVCLVGYGFEPPGELRAAEPDWWMQTPADLVEALMPE